MESEPLKILFIGHDAQLAGAVEELLRKIGPVESAVEPTLDAGFIVLKKKSFQAVLFELPSVNLAGLFQVTALAVKIPRVPVIVLGSTSDEAFAVEAVRAGAQDYFVKGQLDAAALHRAIRYAIERQQERVTLVKEKEDYYGLFDHLVEGIFRTTPDGHYLLANVALARIYGYRSPIELMASITDIGRTLYVKPGQREEFVRLMQAHDTITNFESEIYRKDGSMIWISENCRAVRDGRGNLLYYEGTVADITHSRQTELNLRNSESIYHSLVETMPQNVFRRDIHGRFTFVNQQYCKHFNIKSEDIIGKTDFDFFPKELAEKYFKDDQQVMSTGQTYEIVEEHHPHGQEKTFVQVVKTPLYGADGEIIGLQGIFWDISVQRMAEEKIRRANTELSISREELRKKNQLMQDSLRMAHEIQLTMLPQQYPVFPRNAPPEKSAFQFAQRYHPAETVSGDFFSISQLSDYEVGVLICDVTGHGVSAALVTAMIRALSEELKPLAHDPGMFMRKLNSDLINILKTTGTPMLTTGFYLVANCLTGIVRFANAGHPKPLILRRTAKNVEPLANASGHSQPALGLFDDPPYQTTETTITPGDFVMLFTDGLYEVQGPNEELYSQQRLLVDVKNLIQKPAGQLFDDLLAALRTFSISHEFEDDVCLVGMEYTGKPA